MAKSALKLKARELRRKGESIIVIAKLLKVSKSTVSLWCKDIELTPRQIKTLITRKVNALKIGQILGAQSNRNKKLANIKHYQKEGLRELSLMSKKEFFVAGIALYIAEGSKKNGQIEFINSDALLIKFMLKWIRTFFNSKDSDICFTIFINEMHRSREEAIKKYWRDYLKSPKVRFRNTVFLKSIQKKVYENHDNYFGTFRVALLKGRLNYYRMMGLIQAFFKAKIMSA